MTKEPPKPLPPVNEATRPYGLSGYAGQDAKEMARLASMKRPVELTEELFMTVCDRLIEGEPLVLICADQTMPSRPHIMRHIHRNDKARELYYAAKEMQAETLAEEALLIATDDSNDSSIDPKSGRRISHSDVVSRSKLRIDAIFKIMGSVAPGRFGNKNTTEIQGSAERPVLLEVVTGVPRSADSLIKGVAAPKIIEGVVAERSIKDVD